MEAEIVLVRRIHYKGHCTSCRNSDAMALVREDNAVKKTQNGNWLLGAGPIMPELNPLIEPQSLGPPHPLLSVVYCRNCKVILHHSVIDGKEVMMDSAVEAYQNNQDKLSRLTRE